MELYEKLDLTLINYLNKFTFDEFKLYCRNSCKNDADRKIQYNLLKNFCAANIKAKGQVRRIYSYTLKTPNEVGGRLYCGNSIQGLGSRIRGFLCKNMTDIDMKNAHPVIARYLCKKNGIDCPSLSYYIENRDEILSRFDKSGKTLFLCALNDDKLNRKIKDEFFKSFDKECKMIQTKLSELPEYKHIVDTVPEDRSYNWNGSAFNRIMCVYENKILQEVISLLNSKQIELAALMFDGIMAYGDHYENTQLLRDIETHVNCIFQGLNMIFTYKEHNNEIVIPEDHETYDAERSNDDCYASVKKEFEKTHCKIVNKALFTIETSDDNILLLSSVKFKTAYQHLKYTDYSKNPPSSNCFIAKWFDDEHIRQYEDMGVYPPPKQCPKNIFNLWKPFAIAKYTDDYERNEEGLQKYLNHIKILCGNDETVADYIVKWFAQMYQYPATKTIVPTFISGEGAGKGSLLDVNGRMMGEKKVVSTTTPSRDVWGNFNSIMSDSFLVNLNEMSKKETTDAEGKIKGLITDPQLFINKKGIDSYCINSFHRFIITTNNEDPISTKKGDRRNLIIRSSDEKCGDIEYFKDLHEAFNDINVMRTIYDYLMAIPDMDCFGSLVRPETEYQNDMKEVNRNIFDRWVEDFTRDNRDEIEMKLLGDDQYKIFNHWCLNKGMHYETSAIKMALAIKRLNLQGIQSSIKTKRGNVSVYNIEWLKKHYLIGNFIDQ